MPDRFRMKPSPGFTLMEVLVVLGIVVLLAGMTLAIGSQTVRNTEFDRVRETIRTELSAAQADTIGGTMDSGWGVAFATSTITRYRGTSYASRVTVYDRLTTFGSGVTVTGTRDVTFTRPKGLPLVAATIIIKDGIHTATTTVNLAGSIDVQ